MKIIAETERLIIREMTLEDAPQMFELHSNEEVQRYTGEPIETSLDDLAARMQIRIQSDYVEQGYGRWAVVLKLENKLIGWSGLKYLPEFEAVDLGYRFMPQYWGKGIATEAAIPIMEYGFETLKLQRIIGVAMLGNPASIKVLKKVGMTFDKLAPYDEGGVDVLWYSKDKS